MGAEGSVTLQLRETAGSQSTQQQQQQQIQLQQRDVVGSLLNGGTIVHRTTTTASTSLATLSLSSAKTTDESNVKIGYAGSSGDMLANMLDSIQAAGTNIVLQGKCKWNWLQLYDRAVAPSNWLYLCVHMCGVVMYIDVDADALTTFCLLDDVVGDDEEDVLNGDGDGDGGVFSTFDVPQFDAGKCCWPPPA